MGEGGGGHEVWGGDKGPKDAPPGANGNGHSGRLPVVIFQMMEQTVSGHNAPLPVIICYMMELTVSGCAVCGGQS